MSDHERNVLKEYKPVNALVDYFAHDAGYRPMRRDFWMIELRGGAIFKGVKLRFESGGSLG
jgi:hypothetical protein